MFCLPKQHAQKFVEALIKGEINPEKLSAMSSDERRAEFSKFVGEENASDVNSLFESKLLLKNQKQGYITWAKNVGGIKLETRRNIISQIENLDKILSPAEEKGFLKDLAAQKLGVAVSFEEAKNITELTGKLKSVAEQKDEAGNHTVEYFEALANTKKYVQSLNENPVMAHTVSILRNFLLASVKTPLKVLTETTINRGVEGLIKKVVYGAKNGANPDFANDYAQRAREVYQKTGFNMSSMNSMDEGDMFGDAFAHHEGTSSYTDGKIGALRQGFRVVAKGLDRAVIHYGHGIVFSAHFNGAFAHSVDLESTGIAKAEGLEGEELKNRALELSRSAMKIGTTDKLGKEIRAQAQEDAMRVTNTNNTYGGFVAKGLKTALNSIPGLQWLRLGDLTVPFSKIPGNIVANSLGVAGLDLPRAAYEYKQAWNEYAETGKGNFVQPTRTLVRAVGSMAAAALIASQIDAKHYDEKKGMIKIGNYWVSLELFGLLGPAVNGFIRAKQSKSNEYKIANYAKGASEGLKKLPGVSEIVDLSEYGFKDYVENFVKSRISPAIASDTYKSVHEGTPLPLLIGAKMKSDAQRRQEEREKAAQK